MNRDDLQEEICRQLCADIQLNQRDSDEWVISTPFSYPDGDYYSIYVKKIGQGTVRLSDKANTMMRLSYDTPNVKNYFEGNRGKLTRQILRENDVAESDGNFYVDVSIDKIANGVIRLGQALSQIYDLSYLSRDRVASTFYEDLHDLIDEIARPLTVTLVKKYLVPGMENAEIYPVDFSLQKSGENILFLFGIPTADKAQLVTIILQRFEIRNRQTPALLIFEDQESIPPKALSRLIDANVGGSQVSSINSREAIEQNIGRYVVH